jgi:phospholipid/cholesterol/gamma-HCH transport system ATP-binding protein
MAESQGKTVMMSEPQTLLRVSNISKSFNSNSLLKNVSFSLRERERLSLLGPGGSGKSTLLKIIMGLIRPDSGSVVLFGQSLRELGTQQRQQVLRRISMAFQLGGLFDFMTVRENILFAMENMTDLRPSRMEEVVVDLLKAVNLPFAASKIPSELSGGMRRRVGIVRAMATQPELVLLDEPTAGLDPVTSSVVIDMIHRIADEIGTACLCVTSSVEVAFTFSNRVALLKDGAIAETGTWEDLHRVKDPWIDHFLDVREFVPGSPAD